MEQKKKSEEAVGSISDELNYLQIVRTIHTLIDHNFSKFFLLFPSRYPFGILFANFYLYASNPFLKYFPKIII